MSPEEEERLGRDFFLRKRREEPRPSRSTEVPGRILSGVI
jgi:hypothetical protein